MPKPASTVEPRLRQVHCTNGGCRQQASGSVPVREVAPGILEVGRFICAACGHDLREVRSA